MLMFLSDAALLGLEYALLAVGVSLTFRILNLPDLTVDGSFTLGVVTSAVAAAAGRPFWGLALALGSGALAGCVTGLLQTKAKIHPILAGILTQLGLYTVNITILGGPNLSLLDSETIFSVAMRAMPFLSKTAAKYLCVIVLTAAAVALLSVFFRTVAGLCIRATGNNPEMCRASSIHTDAAVIGALALSNALVALSGGILAQYQGFGDVSSGSGMIVIGLASVILGEVLFGRRSIAAGLCSAVAGSVLYRILIAAALRYNVISANALKLISAAIVAITLALPAAQAAVREHLARREA